MTTARYAQGKRAKGMCDRCGFVYLLHELRYEVFDQRLNGLRVCRYCLDQDHPQLRLGEIVIQDPESLYDPRPDLDEAASTSFFGFDPVGGLNMFSNVELGAVKVVITDGADP